jgi:hypothetical protein
LDESSADAAGQNFNSRLCRVPGWWMLPRRPSSRSPPACWEPWMYSRAPPPFRSWSRSAWTLATAWTFTPEPDAEWVAPLAWSRDALEPRNAVNAWCRVRACPTARCLAPQILDGDRPRLILDTPRGFSAPRCDGTLDWEVCLADVGMTGIGARCTCPVVPACRFLRAALRGYSQMYSSAMAPSRHFATVTIRP